MIYGPCGLLCASEWRLICRAQKRSLFSAARNVTFCLLQVQGPTQRRTLCAGVLLNLACCPFAVCVVHPVMVIARSLTIIRSPPASGSTNATRSERARCRSETHFGPTSFAPFQIRKTWQVRDVRDGLHSLVDLASSRTGFPVRPPTLEDVLAMKILRHGRGATWITARRSANLDKHLLLFDGTCHDRENAQVKYQTDPSLLRGEQRSQIVPWLIQYRMANSREQ